MFKLGLKYFKLSWLNHQSRFPLILSISGVGIAIGCLITSISLMRGFQNESMNKILHIHGHAKIYHRTKNRINLHNNHQERYIDQIKTNGIIMHHTEPVAINARFLDLEDIKFLLSRFMADNFETSNPELSVFIGYRLAKELGIRVGDNINIVFDTANNNQLFGTVSGIFKIGFYEFDKYQVFIDKTGYRRDLAQFIESNTMLYVQKPNKIRDHLNKLNQSYPYLHTETWQETYKYIDDMFKIHARGIVILFGLFMLSSIIQGITNIFMLMMNRARDFAILENMGMTVMQKNIIMFIYATCINISYISFGSCFGILLSKFYVFLRDLLSKYGIDLINKDAFWVSKFDPCILSEDYLLIIICSFIIMQITSIFAICFISQKTAFEWMKNQ